MPGKGHIRYYPAFRLTIPVFGARCLCITPPFATARLLEPFDLHVLGTPPAFVLSHDQTLRRKCFVSFSSDGFVAREEDRADLASPSSGLAIRKMIDGTIFCPCE